MIERDHAAIRQEILSLERSGKIMPGDVVERARDKRSALHACFTWNNTEAAEKWRVEEARKLIRVYVTVEEVGAEPIRAFVSLTSDRKVGGGYRTIASVMSDADLYQQMLDDAFDEMDAYQQKYRRLKELEPVWEAVESAKRKRAAKRKDAA